MSPFWGWMAVAIFLSFVLAFLVLRLVVVQIIAPLWFVTFAVAGSLLVLAVLMAVSTVGVARDVGGRYAASPLKPWFDSLRSGKGLCCSDADGSVVQDADWDSRNGHYRVRLSVYLGDGKTEMQWIEVPDDAVITEPNRAGRTMVWPIAGYHNELTIRCFMPGSMS